MLTSGSSKSKTEGAGIARRRPVLARRRAIAICFWGLAVCAGFLLRASAPLNPGRGAEAHPAPACPRRIAWSSIRTHDLNGRVPDLCGLNRRRVLLFFSCGCSRCQDIGGFLSGPGQALFRDVTVVSVATLPAEPARRLQAAGTLPGLALADPARALADALGVTACPRALAVAPDGKVVAHSYFNESTQQCLWQLAAAFSRA